MIYEQKGTVYSHTPRLSLAVTRTKSPQAIKKCGVWGRKELEAKKDDN